VYFSASKAGVREGNSDSVIVSMEFAAQVGGSVQRFRMKGNEAPAGLLNCRVIGTICEDVKLSICPGRGRGRGRSVKECLGLNARAEAFEFSSREAGCLGQGGIM
jgi:hypothetical protein